MVYKPRTRNDRKPYKCIGKNGKALGMPIVLTSSQEENAQGLLIPELRELLLKTEHRTGKKFLKGRKLKNSALSY
jgi:hypothetical protein